MDLLSLVSIYVICMTFLLVNSSEGAKNSKFSRSLQCFSYDYKNVDFFLPKNL